MSGLIVGLVGPIGVGKTTISDYFAEKGFTRLKFSDPIKEETDRLKLIHSRETYQDLGDRLRQQFGLSHLSEVLIAKIKAKPENDYLIDGFRNPAEVKPFHNLDNFVLIGLNADPKVRFERLRKRAEVHDPKTWEEFEKQEARDQGINQPAHGQQVLTSLELADFVIDTDGVKSEVFRKVEEVIKEFKNDPRRTNTRRSQGCDFC